MIVIKNLKKLYGSKVALDNINLKLESGNAYGLIGVNGAGKSTLINCISGIIKSYKGSIEINKGHIGIMPQDAELDKEFTPLELLNYYYFSTEYGTSKDKKSKQVLKKAGCSSFINKKIKTLSHGMKRKVAIAQSLLNNPEIIILDEPTAGLDPKAIIDIRELINAQRNKNVLLLISSHNAEDIKELCDFLIYVDEGNIKKFEPINAQKGEKIVYLVLQEYTEKNVELIRKIKSVKKIDAKKKQLKIQLHKDYSAQELIKDLVKNKILIKEFRESNNMDKLLNK